MKKKKIKKLLSSNYELILLPKITSSEARTFRFNFLKVLIVLFLIYVISFSALFYMFVYTPLGKIFPTSSYLGNENYSEVIKLQEKILELSREVERVQQINERLNLILEGKPIPIDPRDLDTNYQKEKIRRDSLRLLGNINLSNNIYHIFMKTLNRIPLLYNQMNKLIQDEMGQKNSESREFLFFIKPADGLVTRGYNKSISHFGIDFSVPIGSVVRASASGIVIFADYTVNDGYKIIISHSRGYFTIYKHLSQLLKKERDFVKQGDIIALSGNTGKLTTGPHLHFEIWKYQTPLNPEKILVDLK